MASIQGWPRLTAAILASSLLLLAGHCLVLERTPESLQEGLRVGGDTNEYVAMINGDLSEAEAPFRFRVLVPTVARALPFAPLTSLRLITYMSLGLTYAVLLTACAAVGLRLKESLAGLLLVWSSTWSLYYYHNPFLVDAFGLLVLSAMTYALVSHRFGIFAVVSLLGAAAREQTLFLVPAWGYSRHWGRTLHLFVGVSAILFAIRLVLGGDTDPTLAETLTSAGWFDRPLSYAWEALQSWGLIWGLSLVGLCLLPDRHFLPLLFAYASLLGGSIVASLLAVDTGRMFAVLTPVFTIVASQLFAALLDGSRRLKALAYVLLGVALLQAATALPSTLFSPGSWVFDTTSRVAISVVGMLVSGVIVIALRSDLLVHVAGKWDVVRESVRLASSSSETTTS